MNLFAAQARQGTRLRAAGVRGRYAPSPTGSQHLGNVRTALLAWMQARLAGGGFIMRMEDLDQPRVKPGSAANILDELEWLGLDWDEGGAGGGASAPYLQSERTDLYRAALRILEDKGLVYRCTCSRKEIRMAASAPHGSTPVYPGTCRQGAKGPTDAPFSLRFRVPDRDVGFEDRIAGAVSQAMGREVGDFILRRSDGLFAYQLAVVVDDAAMGVTDVLRGMDLIDSTPRQILLYEALDVQPPDFWHVPLMHTATGERMAKRFGSATLEDYRAGGGDAAALVGELAASVGLLRLGQRVTPRELLTMFDSASFVRRISKAAAGPSAG